MEAEVVAQEGKESHESNQDRGLVVRGPAPPRELMMGLGTLLLQASEVCVAAQGTQAEDTVRLILQPHLARLRELGYLE